MIELDSYSFASGFTDADNDVLLRERHAYVVTGIIIASLMAFCGLIAFAGTRERPLPPGWAAYVSGRFLFATNCTRL